jgi:predicted extracellular nuclease
MANNNPIIMFYNVENLFDTVNDPTKNDDDFLPKSKKKWDDKKFKHKIDQLSKVILSINTAPPTLIGVAEIENAFVLDQLVNDAYLKKFGYKYVHHDSPDERGIDVALIYKEDEFEVIEHRAIPVFLQKNDKTRDILYVKGKFIGDSQVFHFFVNHWPSRGEGEKVSEPKRIAAAKTLRKQLDKLTTEPAPNIIIMGDFNDYPTNNSLIKHVKAKPKSQIAPNEFFNLAYNLHQNGKGSYNYRGHWVMMDQMIVSGNLLLKPNSSYHVLPNALTVFNEDWILHENKKYHDFKPDKTYGGDHYFGGYSDHLPIYIKLKKAEL